MTQILYRYTIKFVVLTDEPILRDQDLDTIYRNTIEGGDSGSWEIERVEELTREEMSKALIEQGSDPSFLLGEEDSMEDAE